MLIAGPPTASLETLRRNARKAGAAPLFVDVILPAVWQAAVDARLDPAVVAGQAANETGWGRFERRPGVPGTIGPGHRNTCGLKTRAGGPDSDPEAHARFLTWPHGARAHVEHLCAYLGRWVPEPRADPRYDWVYGKRPPISHVEELTGSWATQPDYGRLVLRNTLILNEGGSAPMSTVFVSRAEWGHHGGRGGYAMAADVPYVVCHHTPGQEPTSYAEALEELAQVLGGHLAQNWGDIGYTWLVWDRYAFEGRGWGRTGAHAPGANSQSIGIAFLLDGRNRAPTDVEWNTAADICRVGVDHGYLRANFATTGHRDWVATACPSEFVYGSLPSLRAAYEGALPPVPPPALKRKRRAMIPAYYRTDDAGELVTMGDGDLGVAHILDFPPLLPGGVIYHHPRTAGGESLVKFMANGHLMGQNWSGWNLIGSFVVPGDKPDRNGNVGGPVFVSLIVSAEVDYGAIYYAPTS